MRMDLLANVPEGIIVPAIMFATGMVISVTAIIATHWRKARQASENSQLKALMLQRGMPVDEIERVCRAGTELDRHRRDG
jgi:hypothetical protein